MRRGPSAPRTAATCPGSSAPGEGLCTWFDLRRGGPAPEPRAFAGILVSGSRSSVTRPEPWVDDAADLVRRAHDAGTPTLGVCFGHQLIAHAFGATVERNPAGPEIGTLPIQLTDEGRRDPLFHGVGAGAGAIRVNLSHEDAVAPRSLEPGPLRILAHSALTPVQSLAVGEHLRGVQFHPEFSGPVCRAYLEQHRSDLGEERIAALLESASDTPDALAVLRNFRRLFVEHQPPS